MGKTMSMTTFSWKVVPATTSCILGLKNKKNGYKTNYYDKMERHGKRKKKHQLNKSFLEASVFVMLQKDFMTISEQS